MAGVLSFGEALELLKEHAAGLRAKGSEEVPLLRSAGRVLAEDVVADRDQPPFDRATKDGFAVRAQEWSAGMKLRIAGLVRAGESWSGGPMGSGEAVEIMTGAAVPAGADAVAMVEHAEREGDAVWAVTGRRLDVRENVVARGSEARSGERVLPAGMTMSAAEIAVAATCGRSRLKVATRPRVGILATGDELVDVDETPGEWQIRNSNGYALAALVEAAGGEPVRLGIAQDERDDLRRKIADGLECDLLVLSGGVSAGKYDLVEEVLVEFGAEFLFTGVKMQPGRPVVFGRVGGSASWRASESASQRVSEVGTYFFGLPGNPVSTQVTFHCFVEPFVAAMCGAGWNGPRFAQATLAEDVAAKAGLVRILPARMESGVERTELRLVGWQGSGDMAANARANCYAVLPDGREMKVGDRVSVLLR